MEYIIAYLAYLFIGIMAIGHTQEKVLIHRIDCLPYHSIVGIVTIWPIVVGVIVTNRLMK